MKEPRIAATKPAVVELKAGETVYWCSCGLSKTQPFCDGSHQDTGFEPMVFTAEKDDRYYFCQCKHSGTNPLCDGTHKSLKADEPL